ncbi:TPA: hypothetical protein ACJK1Q_004459 [Salmonella enterica subsp. enterica serovar Typhimurium]|nr:hypothetical protein [Salmonella enterica]EEA6574669.1 hypothetical protein [Salmonella enterica]
MGKLCSVVGDKITPCEVLAAALEYGNPRPKSKGIFLPERVNINTGEKGISIVQVHSGAYVGRGAAVLFCPFCGTNLETWSNKN